MASENETTSNRDISTSAGDEYERINCHLLLLYHVFDTDLFLPSKSPGDLSSLRPRAVGKHV